MLVLLQHLNRSRFELHLGLFKTKGEFIADVPKDVAVHDLNVSRVRYALPSIVKLAWKVKPNVILSTLAHLNLALILSRFLLPRGTRLLIREAVIASAFLQQETRHPQVWKWLYRRFYKRADRIVCLSDSMINDLVERFDVPRMKTVRIYNPVDIERVREMAAREGNPYSGPGPQLVAAGRLCRQKGFDVLLDAMPAVLARFPDAQLAILGDGPLRSDLVARTRRLGLGEAVQFLGYQPNPWPYLRHADLFVLPSRYEGLPNILLEALALGVPVVATDCPGGTREVSSSDPGVFLVPTENVTVLADALISTCTKARSSHRLAQENAELLSRFTTRNIIDEYSALLLN
jgi:glycosyltransferase involved in cell wall biosynthesis